MTKLSLTVFLTVASLAAPVVAMAQGSGGGSSGGGAGSASSGSASSGGVSGSSTGTGATSAPGVAGAANGGQANGSQVPNGSAYVDNSKNVTNRVQNLQTTPSAENPQITPGTNTAGTANSSGGTGAPAAGGSITTGMAGNRAGGTSSGRIDGTVTPGPAMPGDDTIRAEDSQDSKVDKKIKSICKGC